MPFLAPAPFAPPKCSGRGPCRRLPPPSPSSQLAPPFACRVMRRRRRRVLASWLLNLWVGFRPPRLSSPFGTGNLCGLLGFCPPWAPLPLWLCGRPEAAQLPRPLCGGPTRGFPQLRRHHAPPPPPPLCGAWGPLWRPHGLLCFPPHPRILLPLFPAGFCHVPLAPASPLPRPCLTPRRPCVPTSSAGAERAFHLWLLSARVSPCTLPRRFLACAMATPSACRQSLPAPPPAFRPSPSPHPTLCHSRCSTPYCWRPYPLVRPHGAHPCLRRFLPGHRAPCARAPPPLSSFPLRLSPIPSLLRRVAPPKRPRSGLPPLFLPSPPPVGPCGHSPLPLRSCPGHGHEYCP